MSYLVLTRPLKSCFGLRDVFAKWCAWRSQIICSKVIVIVMIYLLWTCIWNCRDWQAMLSPSRFLQVCDSRTWLQSRILEIAFITSSRVHGPLNYWHMVSIYFAFLRIEAKVCRWIYIHDANHAKKSLTSTLHLTCTINYITTATTATAICPRNVPRCLQKPYISM